MRSIFRKSKKRVDKESSSKVVEESQVETKEEKADTVEFKKGTVLKKISPLSIKRKLSKLALKGIHKVKAFKKAHPRRFVALAFASLILLVVLLSSAVYALTLSNEIQREDKADAFLVLGAIPNDYSAPHPIGEPILIEFSQSPTIDLTFLNQNILLEPFIPVSASIDVQDNNKLVLTPTENFKESTQYKVTVKAGYYGYELNLQEDYVYYFYTQGSVSGNVSEYTAVWVDSYYNEEHSYAVSIGRHNFEEDFEVPKNVDVSLYKTNADTLLKTLEDTVKENRYGVLKFQPDSENLSEISTWNVEAIEGEYSFSVETSLPENLEKGVYYMKLVANGEILKSNFVVLNTYAVAMRRVSGKDVYFAQDLKESKAIANLSIAGYLSNEDGAFESTGQAAITNQQGLTNEISDSRDFSVLDYNGEFGIISNYYSIHKKTAGWSDWVSYFDNRYNAPQFYFITDRLLYAPGETIYYKIIGRERVKDIWFPIGASAGFTTELSYYDYTNYETTTIETKSTSFDQNGNAWGSFVAPTNVSANSMTINLTYDEQYLGSKYIQLADFEKPSYEVSVELDKEEYKNSDEATINIHANYYSGSAASNVKVKVNFNVNEQYYPQSDLYACDQLKNGYSYSYSSNYDLYETKEIQLDDMGSAEIKFKIDTIASNELGRVSVEAIISDDLATSSIGSDSATFYPSDKYLLLKSDSYSTPTQEDFYLNLQVIDSKCSNLSEQKLKYTVDRITYGYQEGNGKYGYYSRNEVQVEKGEVMVNGTATLQKFNFTEQGSYEFTYFLETAHGEIQATKYIWLYPEINTGSIYDREGSSSQIVVQADKELYNVGETANITIFHPNLRGDAWVTINRASIHENKIIQLAEYKTQFSFEVKEEYVGGGVITVGAFANNRYSSDTFFFDVNKDYKKVDISIKTNQEVYQPSETVEVEVSTSNMSNPIKSNLAIAVVDKAILDIQWFNSSMLEDYYRLYVANISEKNSLEVINITGDGGSGSGGDGMRDNFLNTAYWNPNLETDNNGNASFSFDLPDNLTTWAVIVWATGDRGAFGEASKLMKVTTPLAIQTYLPENLVVGDQVVLSTRVINGTEDLQNVKVTAKLGMGLSLEGSASQNISVPALSTRLVEWKLKANQVNENISVVFEAQGSDYDGIQLYTNVFPVGYEFFEGKNVVGGGAYTLTTQSSSNTVSINVTDNVLGEVPNALKYLTGYPYGCSEQTSSKIYANSIPLIYASELAGYDITDPNTLKNDISSGLETIYKMQNIDGGFGWWGYSDSQPNLSAHVLVAFHSVEQSGVALDQTIKQRLIDYLSSNLGMNSYVSYALSLYGYVYTDPIDLALLDISTYSTSDVLYWSLSAQNMGLSSQSSALVAEVIARKKEASDMIYWESVGDLFYESNNASASSLALKVLVNANEKELADRAMLWLRSNKKGNYWYNTTATLQTIDALLAYSKKYGASSNGANVVVSIDGNTVYNAAPNQSIQIDDLSVGSHSVNVVTESSNTITSVFLSEFRNDQPSVVSPFVINTRITDENGSEIKELEVGEYALFVVEMSSDSQLSYVHLKNIIPSGLEIINTTLGNFALPNEFQNSSFYYNNWNYYPSVIRNQESSVFIHYLDGSETIVIPVRARTMGVYVVNPSIIQMMYKPDVWNLNKPSSFKVVE